MTCEGGSVGEIRPQPQQQWMQKQNVAEIVRDGQPSEVVEEREDAHSIQLGSGTDQMIGATHGSARSAKHVCSDWWENSCVGDRNGTHERTANPVGVQMVLERV